jgi:hypothetical protein
MGDKPRSAVGSVQIATDESAAITPQSPFSPRVFVVGLLLCLGISVGAPYSNVYLQGSLMAIDFSTAAALFLIFLFVLVNIALQALHPRLAFRANEMAVLYSMMVTACAIPTMGLMEYLLPSLTALGYYTTPENEWQQLIQPYVKEWMVVQDPLAIKYFYEGLPRGSAIPWGAWVQPLCAWSIFILALYLTMICAAVIIRRQWMEHERLIYPLVQVPLAVMRQDGRTVPPLLRNPLMWTAFLAAVAVGSMKGLHHYYPAVPDIVMTTSIPIFRNTVSLPIMLSFTMVGLSYFVNLEIVLGLWVFALMALCEQGIFSVLGIQSTEIVSVYGTPQSPYLAHQGIGAMLVYVILGLWTARRHLGNVWRCAWNGDKSVDDSSEMMSYRGAVGGLVGGVLVMGIWLWMSGISLLVLVIFLLIAFGIFFGLTRIVAEGGVAAARSPMIASTFVVSGVGTPLVGPEGLVALAYTYIWHGDVRTFIMASCTNGLKVLEGVRHLRPLFWTLVLAIAVTLIGSAVTILHLSYTYGGVNLHGWFFGAGPQVPFQFITHKLQNLPLVQWDGWFFKGVGGAIMAILTALRHRFLWWPFHPLGFAICTVSYIVGRIWFSFFLTWLLKLIILKYGGPNLYRKLGPFFIGLVLGQTCNAGFWIFIDFFSGMTGNGIGALFW